MDADNFVLLLIYSLVLACETAIKFSDIYLFIYQSINRKLVF